MKLQHKIILFFIVAAMVKWIPVNAQKHYVGVKLGPNFSNFKPGNANKFAVGIAVGATYSYQMQNGLTLGADLLYLQQGFLVNALGKHRQSFNYISIPLKVGYTFGTTWQLFANAGIVPNFLVGANVNSKVLNTNNTTRNYDSFKKFDIGILAELGGGYTFKERFNVFASLGFQYFFVPNTSSNADYVDRPKSFNIPFTVGFRYVF